MLKSFFAKISSSASSIASKYIWKLDGEDRVISLDDLEEVVIERTDAFNIEAKSEELDSQSIDKEWVDVDVKDAMSLKSFIAAQTFQEELENDVKVSREYMTKTPSSDLDNAGIEVYKRAIFLIASGNMEVISGEEQLNASENSMPASSYLSHGARILVELPAGTGDELFNWLTSGDKEKTGASHAKSQKAAIEEGKYVYNRYAATHGIKINKDGSVSETKGFKIGVKDFVTSKGSELIGGALNLFAKYTGLGVDSLVKEGLHDFDASSVTNHYGIDLSLGVVDGKDREANVVEDVDGDHGHFYIYYQKPTENSKGAILFGIEGSSPDSAHHSKLGASDPYSPSYGSLWEDLAKKDGADECVIGKKYNGRKITLSADELKKIVEINVSNLDSETLATAIPLSSVDSFLEKVSIPMEVNAVETSHVLEEKYSIINEDEDENDAEWEVVDSDYESEFEDEYRDTSDESDVESTPRGGNFGTWAEYYDYINGKDANLEQAVYVEESSSNYKKFVAPLLDVIVDKAEGKDQPVRHSGSFDSVEEFEAWVEEVVENGGVVDLAQSVYIKPKSVIETQQPEVSYPDVAADYVIDFDVEGYEPAPEEVPSAGQHSYFWSFWS